LKAIATVEFEKDEANLKRAMVNIELFKDQSINTWQETLLNIEQEKKQLLFRAKEIENQLLKYVITAPNNGELQNILTLNTNQFVAAGMKVAEITPDAALMAICWVSPKDIGLIQKEMKGLFQIDAYNPNEWGHVTGRVTEISSDTYLLNSQPFFKVKCQLDSDRLWLPNGIEGKVKKGMTLQATLHVAERTLYQLLYDKLDNWLNPTRK